MSPLHKQQSQATTSQSIWSDALFPASRSHIPEGTEPVKLFPAKLALRRLVQLEMDAGMAPLKAFELTKKTSRSERCPIAGGSVPVSSLTLRSTLLSALPKAAT